MKQQTVILVFAVFVQLTLGTTVGKFIGGTTGPCSAVSIPGPFTTSVNVFGDTTAHGIFNVSNSLCVSSTSSPAVWYSIQPENYKQITLSTCNADTTFDTIISLYTGSCELLHCITFNDDDTTCDHPRSSVLTFTPNAFEVYHVSVGGFGVATGTFQLVVTENRSPDGSSCNSAIPLLMPIVDQVYSNSEGTGYASSCTNAKWKYLWFSVINVKADVPLNITTCSYYTTMDTVVAVFNSCSNTTCAAFNDDTYCFYIGSTSSITYTPPTSDNLYVVVGGFGSTEGQFGLSIEQAGISTYDECYDGKRTSLGHSINGTTLDSLPLFSAPCFLSLKHKQTEWFYFTAPASISIVASTCNSYTNFDTSLFIYRGACDSLFCVSSSPVTYCADTFANEKNLAPSTQTSDYYGNAVLFTSLAVNSETYFVVVSGAKDGDSGNFSLYVGEYST